MGGASVHHIEALNVACLAENIPEGINSSLITLDLELFKQETQSDFITGKKSQTSRQLQTISGQEVLWKFQKEKQNRKLGKMTHFALCLVWLSGEYPQKC